MATSHLLDLLLPTVSAATAFTVNSTGDGADTPQGATITNTAAAASTISDPTPGNNSLSTTTNVVNALILTVNDTGDAADSNVGDRICDTSAAPGDQCTLRAAIQETNAASSADTIGFSLLGIMNGSASTTTLVNSTVSGNTTNGSGGGIFNFNATMSLINVTVTNNRSDSDNNSSGAENGGGVHPAGGSLFLSNSIVAANFYGSSLSPIANDVSYGVSSTSSFNMIGVCDGCGLINGVNNNQVGLIDARLGPLANNGGPTQTHALLAGSPALDAGNNAFVTDPPFTGPTFNDQRGTEFLRIRDASDANTTQTVDIGAFEADPSVEDIFDKSTSEDVALPTFTFNVGDAATPFTSITGTSSNTTLVPDANIVVGPDTPMAIPSRRKW